MSVDARLDVPPSTGELRLPGDVDMWVFVLGDLVFFAAYFVIFMLYRDHERQVFLAAQSHLNLVVGALNTLVLLASSRFVASAVRATRAGDDRRALSLLRSGAAFGVLFICLKAYEWSTEIAHGHTLVSNDFFMFYFMLTGLHLLHVVVGLGVVALGASSVRRGAPNRMSVLEACATYWHMVDLLWIVIFVLLYLVR